MAAVPDPYDFTAELEALERKFAAAPTGGVVFYGSSSIRLWPHLKREFPAADAQNLGFGGSTLHACAREFSRLVVPRGPRAIILYAGENDLTLGAGAEDVWDAFGQLLDQRDQFLGAVPLAFLSIKPTPSRWDLLPLVEETNEWCHREILSREEARWVDVATPMFGPARTPRPELFMADRMHLSRAGYAVWNGILHREIGDLLG